jgi:hypothetical protein
MAGADLIRSVTTRYADAIAARCSHMGESARDEDGAPGRGVAGSEGSVVERTRVDFDGTDSPCTQLVQALIGMDLLDAEGPRVAYRYLDCDAIDALFGRADAGTVRVDIQLDDTLVAVLGDGTLVASR